MESEGDLGWAQVIAECHLTWFKPMNLPLTKGPRKAIIQFLLLIRVHYSMGESGSSEFLTKRNLESRSSGVTVLTWQPEAQILGMLLLPKFVGSLPTCMGFLPTCMAPFPCEWIVSLCMRALFWSHPLG